MKPSNQWISPSQSVAPFSPDAEATWVLSANSQQIYEYYDQFMELPGLVEYDQTYSQQAPYDHSVFPQPGPTSAPAQQVTIPRLPSDQSKSSERATVAEQRRDRRRAQNREAQRIFRARKNQSIAVLQARIEKLNEQNEEKEKSLKKLDVLRDSLLARMSELEEEVRDFAAEGLGGGLEEEEDAKVRRETVGTDDVEERGGVKTTRPYV